MTSESLRKIIERTVCSCALFALIALVGCKSKRGGDSETDMKFYKKYLEGRYAVRLKAPVILRNQAGEIVGRLEPGCIIQSPSIEDVGGDISDNQRMKVVFDIADRTLWETVDGLPILEGEPVSVKPTP